MFYSGIILDQQSDTPLPSATVTLVNGSQIVHQMAAGSTGHFSFDSDKPATNIVVSHAGYTTTMFPADTNQYRFTLERNYATGDPVVVTAGKKNLSKWLLWGLLAAVAITYSQKRSA